ncbi:MAG: ligand-binding sensor domain-containing protein/signal transduction histidine kinase [Phenylobacterium sp.]|jgi:ligand-binding sensor domain-containing protein/signal transduction histidine kinase
MRFVILLLTLFYSSLALASGPVTRFERLSLEDGLSQVSVASIAQDQEGFIWFATQDGLNRYDGYEFKVFRHDPASPNSISNSWVRVIHIDSSGTLWIGTNGSGIDKYDPQSESFIHYQHQPGNPNSLSHNTVRAIFSDANGTLWVGTDGGLNQFDNQSNQFVHFSHHATDPHSLSHNHVKAIYQDSKSNLWIGTDDGLNKLDASQFNQPSTAKPLHFEHFKHQPSNPHSLSHNEVKAINEDASGTLWVGTLGGGINKLDSQTGLFSHYKNIDGDPNSISNDYIMSIDKDAQGILWIGTEGGGLNRFDGTDQQMIHFRHQTSDTHSLSADFVDIVFESDDGTLWIGTNNGLSKYNRKQALFGHFNHQISAPFSLSHNGINAFAQSPDGILWIGTDDGLNRFDAQSQQFHHFKHQPSDPNSLSHNTIGALVFDHQGRLWVGTLGGGLDLFDQTTGQFSHFRHQPTNPHSVSHNRIKSLTVDSDGTLWVGTLGGGLDKFDHHSQRFKHFVHQPNNADSLSHNRISAIYQDSKGKLWIGTTGGGLNQFDINDEKFVRFKHHRSDEGSLSHDYILSIIEDSKGSLWIGTGGGGLNHYNRQTSAFTYYSEKHGLPNDIVYAALEDKAGFLWLSTNQGLCKFNPASRTCRNFDVSDGLQSNEFNLGAYFKSADGELFFGGVNGFNRFYPQMQKDQRQAPTVVLTKLLLFNQSVPIRALNAHNTHHLRFTLGKAVNQLDQLTLNHQQNLMTFEFAALDFISPMKNQYAYQLEGWDKNWIYTDAKNRRATYTNIPPGRYTLRVKASNGHAQNQWQQAGKSLKITLLPPPWLTWWAYLIYSLIFTALLSALVILLVHLLSEQKNRQGQQLILDQLQQVDKLKDEFLTHTSHELRTPLNGIIGLTESLIAGAAGVLPNKANHKLAVVASSGKRLAHLVDNILDFSRLKDNTLPLYPSAIDLRAITDMVLTLSHPLVSHKNLGLINDVSAKLPKVHADETRLQQILYNLVSNAIKFTEQGSVTVSATPINDWQWLEISCAHPHPPPSG